MSLLPDSATFHERVQECFVAHRGRGVSLSGKDVELLDEWARLAVPFEVVARGIRKAAEAALWDAADETRALRSLTACRGAVKRELDKYLKLTAGRTEAGPGDPSADLVATRHKKLVATLAKLARTDARLRPSLGDTAARLPRPGDLDALARQEELATLLVLRALGFEERLRLLREARGLVQNHALMSPRARRDSLRFHRAALVRRSLELAPFW